MEAARATVVALSNLENMVFVVLCVKVD